MTSDHPQRISILLVAHNAASTIGQALASLLAQTFPNWTCHIVDDASTDATPQLLERLADPRFRVLRAPRRLGRGGARNLALRHATGEYLASLDADDFLFPEALASQAQTLDDDPRLTACTGSLLLFSPEYRLLGRRRTQIGPGTHAITSPLTTRVPLGSTMIRRSSVKSNFFDEQLKRSEDRDFFDRVLDGTVLRVLEEPTYAYRWSLQLDNVMEGLKNREALFQRRLRTSPVRAAQQIVWTRCKRLCYPTFSIWGLWDALNRWRAVSPTTGEMALFESTLQLIRERERSLYS